MTSWLGTYEYNIVRVVYELIEEVKMRGGCPVGYGGVYARSCGCRYNGKQPIVTQYGTSAHFVLDDAYYVFKADDNPFFDDYFGKFAVRNSGEDCKGKVFEVPRGNTLVEFDRNRWADDGMLSPDYDSHRKAAIKLLDEMIGEEKCVKAPDGWTTCCAC